MTVYYLADNDTYEMLMDWSRNKNENLRNCKAIISQYGELDPENPFVTDSDQTIVGFIFKEKPDVKAWVQVRNSCITYYRPRLSSKVGKKLSAALKPCLRNSLSHVVEACGYNNIIFSTDGKYSSRPGFETVKGKLIVSYPDFAVSHPSCQIPKSFRELKRSEYEKLIEQRSVNS